MLIKNKYLVVIAIAASLIGCKQVPMLPGMGAHKIDIQQGNAITQDMVAKLQPGMSRSQVRFVLGTPLLVDPFRSDRWDYFYSYMKGGVVIEERRLVVFFKDDKLDRVEGDVIAAKPPTAEKTIGDKIQPAAAKPETAKPSAKPEPPKPVAADAPAPATAKPEAKAEKKAEDKPKEERGFFGRILDRIGL